MTFWQNASENDTFPFYLHVFSELSVLSAFHRTKVKLGWFGKKKKKKKDMHS